MQKAGPAQTCLASFIIVPPRGMRIGSMKPCISRDGACGHQADHDVTRNDTGMPMTPAAMFESPFSVSQVPLNSSGTP